MILVIMLESGDIGKAQSTVSIVNAHPRVYIKRLKVLLVPINEHCCVTCWIKT